MKNVLSECQRKLLAMLKFKDPERYNEKLTQLGANEKDLTEDLVREAQRIKTNNSIKKARFVNKTIIPLPVPVKKKPLASIVKTKAVTKSIYILVDGDNNAYKNMIGYKKAKKMKGVTIVVYVANEEMAKKYKNQYGMKNTKLIESGPQAVDRRIMTIAGNKAKSHEYDHIVIVSKDQGYKQNIEKWKKDYNWDDNGIRLCEDLAGAIKIS